MDFTVNLGLFILATYIFLKSKKNIKDSIRENKLFEEKPTEKEISLITKCFKIYNIFYFFVVIIFVVESILSLLLKLPSIPIAFITFILPHIVLPVVLDYLEEYEVIPDLRKILINYIYNTPPYLVAFTLLFFPLTIIFLFTYLIFY